jgi:hypothetical protein
MLDKKTLDTLFVEVYYRFNTGKEDDPRIYDKRLQ